MRPQSERVYFDTFDVTGRGPFPLDMLRYDHCWPASQDAVSRIGASLSPQREPAAEQTIRLRRWTNEPKASLNPRWHSYGWTPTEVA
jgi:hypothetical protein